MHNMAWLRAHRLRVSDCGLAGELSSSETHALLSAESLASFDSLIGSTSLSALVPVLRAQILTVRKEYGEALAILESEVTSAVRQGMGRLQADLLADRAWCRFQAGQRNAALEEAELAESLIDASEFFDDRALAHGRLAQLFSALGRGEAALRNRALATSAWEGHVALQQQIIEALSQVPVPDAG
jgi:tetratricopeptide (TPR) repeat protein